MKYYKWLIILFCITGHFFSEAADSATQHIKKDYKVRVAIVDIQFILENSIALQEVRKTVDQISQEIHQQMTKKESELKQKEEALLTKRSTMIEEKFEQEVNLFNKKVSEAQQDMQKRKTRLERAHAEAVGKIHQTTINIISDLAKKNNLNLVIPSTQVLFAKNNLLMTDEVILLLNSKLKYVKINYE